MTCPEPGCQLPAHGPREHPCGKPAQPEGATCDCGCGVTPWRDCPNYYRIEDLSFADQKALFAGIGLSLRKDQP